MTDQSKYQIAIEAIRTKHFYHREWNEAIKHVDAMSWGPLDLAGAIKQVQVNFEGWAYEIKVNEDGCHASLSKGELSFAVTLGCASYDPAPNRALLIVMLMALEEMDKLEAQS